MADPKARIVIDADASPAERALDRLRSSFSQLGRSLPLAPLTSFAGIIGGLSFGAVAVAFKDLVGRLDDLGDSAQGLGLMASELSRFQLSAQAAGVDAEQFSAALTRLNVRIGEAATGNKEAQQLFRALGVAVRDASGNVRSTGEVLGDVADKFSRLRDGVAKSALSVELFGRSGGKFIAFLNEGREGLVKFGGVSDETVGRAQKLQGQIDRLSASWERLKLTLAGTVAGGINRLIDEDAVNSADRVLQRVERRIGVLRQQLGGRLNPEIRQAIEIELRDLEKQADAARAAARALLFSDQGYAGAARESADAILANARAKEENRQKTEELIRASTAYADQLRLERTALSDFIGRRDLDEAAAKYRELQAQRAVKETAGIREEATKTKSAMEQLGLTFQSAFEDAVLAGNGFRSVLQAIGRDIARIFVRKAITEPAGAFLLDLFKGVVPGFDVGTPYVPRDMLAVVHRGERIIPAKDNRAGAAAGGAAIRIEQSFTFNGTPNMQEMRAFAAQVRRETMLGIYEAQRRGGALSVA